MLIRFLISFLCGVFLLAPSAVFASFEISEIMYDLPGADAGREWVELHNTGVGLVDIANWKLYESNTNHRLVPEGSSIIPEGGYAIIADDVVKFKSDWPSYRGVLFSSSFSLSNSGEVIAFHDASSTVITSLSYTPQGARGNGNSLNFVSGALVERAPSPGEVTSASALPVKVAASSVGNSSVTQRVQKSDSAAPSPKDAGAVSIPGSENASGAFFSFQDGTFPGMIPWILALFCVILIGVSAIFFVRGESKKETKSGYRIIEEK